MKQLVRDIRELDKAMGDSVIKIYNSEKPFIQKLRRKTWRVDTDSAG